MARNRVGESGASARRSIHHRLIGVERRDRLVRVIWDDDQVGEFHCMWLRDNWGCPECRHPQTLERTFDLLTVPEDLGAETAAVTANGAMRITWPDDGHVSLYDPGWLRTHARLAKADKAAPEPPRLWGASLADDMPTVSYAEVMSSDASLLEWLKMLRDSGFVLMRGTPPEPLEVLRIAGRISDPRPTNFGVHFDVVSMPNPNSNAYTSLACHCHTDLPYYEIPAAYQFLHCLKNDAAGGESAFVDGSMWPTRCAARMRRRSTFWPGRRSISGIMTGLRTSAPAPRLFA